MILNQLLCLHIVRVYLIRWRWHLVVHMVVWPVWLIGNLKVLVSEWNLRTDHIVLLTLWIRWFGSMRKEIVTLHQHVCLVNFLILHIFIMIWILNIWTTTIECILLLVLVRLFVDVVQCKRLEIVKWCVSCTLFASQGLFDVVTFALVGQ